MEASTEVQESVDWDEELDLLSEYMVYYIEYLTTKSLIPKGLDVYELLKNYNMTGLLPWTSDKEYRLYTFEEWKEFQQQLKNDL